MTETMPFPPLVDTYQRRIEITTSCRDCDVIPKVARAGEVVVDGGARVQIMHNGLKVLAGAYGGEIIQRIVTTLRGHHEPQEELLFHFVLPLLGDNPMMLELGGYWSFYTMWFLREARGNARALVVEPDPKNIEVGRRNVALNGFQSQVDFVQAFCSDLSRETAPFRTEVDGVQNIRSVNIADYLRDKAIDKLDMLHMDIQGAELTVLKSLKAVLDSKAIKFVFVSTHHRSFSGDPLTHERCLHFLRQCGGQILAEHDVFESYSADGLIVAHFAEDALSWPNPHMSLNRASTSLFRSPSFDLGEAYLGSKPTPA